MLDPPSLYSGRAGRSTLSRSETVFDRWLAVARTGLFGVLLTMAKETGSQTKWSIFGMSFDFVQLLVFPLNSSQLFPWSKMSNMQWLLTLLVNINPGSTAAAASPIVKLTVLFFACAWMTATAAAAVYAAYSFINGNFTTVLPLKFLRTTARLTTSALFVPFATVLISVYNCRSGSSWSVTTWECYGPEHSALVAMVTPLLLCFWAFTLCCSAVFFDRKYASSNIMARAHGRVNIGIISVKSGLALLYAMSYGVDAWFVHTVVLASGTLWLWLWLRYLPCYTQWMNCAWSAFVSVFMWASFCAILAKLLNDPQAGVAGYVFYLGVPTAAYTGYALAYMRFQSYARVGNIVEMQRVREAAGTGAAGEVVYIERSVHVPATSISLTAGDGLWSPFDVELKARYILRDVMAARRAEHKAHSHGHGHGGGHLVGIGAAALAHRGHPSRRGSVATSADPAPRRNSGVQLSFPDPDTISSHGSRAVHAPVDAARGGYMQLQSVDLDAQQLEVEPQARAPPASGGRHASGGTHNLSGVASHTALQIHAPPPRPGVAELGMSTARAVVSSIAGMLGARSSVVHVSADDEATAVAHVSALYVAAKRLFPSSAALDLFHANHLRCFAAQDVAVQLEIVMAGLSKEPPIDIRFLLLQSKRALEETAAAAVPAASGPSGHHAHGTPSHKSMSIIDRVQYETLMAESIEMSMKARSHEHAFWTELRARMPDLTVLHRHSEAMSTAINKATVAFDRLISMRSDSVEVLQSYAVFLLEVKRDAAAATRYFNTADELLSAAGVLQEDENLVAAPDESVVISKSSTQGMGVIRASSGASGGGDQQSASPSVPSIAGSNDVDRSILMRRGSGAAASVASDIVMSLAQSRRMSGSHAASLVAQRARRASISDARISITDAVGVVSTASAVSSASAAVTDMSAADAVLALAASVGDMSRTPSHDSLASRQQRSRVTQSPTRHPLTGPQRHAAAAVAGPGAVAPPPSHSRSRSVTPMLSHMSSIGSTAPLPRAHSVSRAHADARRGSFARSETHGVLGSGHGEDDSLLKGKHRRGSAATAAYAAAVSRHRRASLRLGSDASLAHAPSGSISHASAAATTAVSSPPAHVSVAVARPSPDVDEDGNPLSAREIERRKTLARASRHARAVANDSHNAAASALRMSIRSQAAVMEPSLLLLSRTVGVMFIIAVACVCALAGIQRTYMDKYAAGMSVVRACADRQQALESVLHDTWIATRLNAGVYVSATLPPPAMNATLSSLAAAAATFTSLHRYIFLNGGGPTPAEAAKYDLGRVTITDAMCSVAAGCVPSALRVLSFQDAGLELTTRAQLLLTLPPRNMTLSNELVWYTLMNGGGVLRDASRSSTSLYSERIDSLEEMVKSLNAGYAITVCLLFACVCVCVLVPIVARVKAHTDDIFSVFLNLPDHIVKEMQTTCATQIAALKSLADDPEAIALAVAVQEAQEEEQGHGEVSGGDTGGTYTPVASTLGGAASPGVPGVHFRDTVEREDVIREIGAALGGSGDGAPTGHIMMVSPRRLTAGVWQTRAFKATYGMQLRLLARFSWPLIAVAVFFAVVYAYEGMTISAMRMYRVYGTQFGAVRAGLWRADADMLRVLLDGPTLASPASTRPLTSLPALCNASTITATLTSLSALQTQLNGLQDSILFGDPVSVQAASGGVPAPVASRTGVSVAPDVEAIMLEDACRVPGIPAACSNPSSVYYGLLSGGLQASMREFLMGCVQAAQVATIAVASASGAGRTNALNVTALAPDGSIVSTLCPTVAVYTPQLMDTLLTEFVDTGFERVETLMLSYSSAVSAAFIAGHAALTVVWIVVCVALYVCVYVRNIRKMDADMKRTRGTLLMFPADVLAGVAQFMRRRGDTLGRAHEESASDGDAAPAASLAVDSRSVAMMTQPHVGTPSPHRQPHRHRERGPSPSHGSVNSSGRQAGPSRASRGTRVAPSPGAPVRSDSSFPMRGAQRVNSGASGSVGVAQSWVRRGGTSPGPPPRR